MKTKVCSKCKRELPLTCFWTHTNKEGVYPSCKECEVAARNRRIVERPLCVKCGINKHTPKSEYCTDCARVVAGKGPRTRINRTSGLEWCKVCGIRPKLHYAVYCLECKREINRKTSPKKWRERYNTPTKRHMANVRAYAAQLAARGIRPRGPCVFCGAPGTEFHHYDYLPKTLNFDDVCKPCHVLTHRFLKTMLTLMQAGAIHLPAPAD